MTREVFGVSGTDKALKMPKTSVPHESVVTAAGAMAEAAEKKDSVFVEHGLSKDFVAELRAAPDASFAT